MKKRIFSTPSLAVPLPIKSLCLIPAPTDSTQRIAEDAGAAFVFHAWEGYARQKNWGLDNLPITTDWVFILDADESITSDLRDELMRIASDPDNMTSGYFVNRYFVWERQEIRHCGYYPSWNLRFFRRCKARYERARRP